MFGGGPEIYSIDADHIIKSQGCPSSGPCRSIESQQDEINLSWNNIGPEGAKPDVWHNSLWLQVSENHIMKMESWCTIDVRDFYDISVGQVFSYWARSFKNL